MFSFVLFYLQYFKKLQTILYGVRIIMNFEMGRCLFVCYTLVYGG
jgi:hypothetical protein